LKTSILMMKEHLPKNTNVYSSAENTDKGNAQPEQPSSFPKSETLATFNLEQKQEVAIAFPIGKDQTALIDRLDADFIEDYQWYLSKAMGGYIQRQVTQEGKVKNIYLHREIAQRMVGDRPLTNKDFVEYQNENKLDNRRENLLITTISEHGQRRKKSQRNKSGYRGVFYSKNREKWQASIQAHRKKEFLGYYQTPEEAAQAYNNAATRHYGDKARLNELPDRPTEHTNEITDQGNQH
jgi:AP2 domain.